MSVVSYVAPAWRSSSPTLAGCYFDQAAADAAVRFFASHCVFTADRWAGRPFALEPWQSEAIIRPAFGWKRADGTRLYRRIVIWVPRKNGKTELLAGVSHLCLLGDGLIGGQCYSIAAKQQQAAIVFRAARQMVVYSQSLQPHYEVFTDSLYVHSLNAKFQALSGKAEGTHGLGASVLLGDEVHEWKTDRLYQFVRQSMAHRLEPMEWLISTAGLAEGFGFELWQDCLKIADGTVDVDDTLVAIWAAGADDDIHDPATWARANPNLGVSVTLEYMRNESAKARQFPRYENDFRRYHLNQWVNQASRWLPMDRWNECDPYPQREQRWRTDLVRLVGRRCWGGLDLASTRDICALVWVFEPTADDPHWVVVCRFWWPRANAEAAMRSSMLPFDAWARDGAIELTDGDAADHDRICDAIMEDAALYDVQALGIDEFNAHSVATRLFEQGVPVQRVKFNMLHMSQPSKRLEMMMLGRELDHMGNPVLRWMASNVAVREDSNGNIFPGKKRSAGKIDGIAALVMALAVNGAAEPVVPSYLLSSPLIVI